MQHLCELLGHPERSAPAVHVTGTNGKGSTSRLVAALIGQSGLRTGLYTSPHLERIEERIVVAGEPISRGDFVRLVEDLAPRFDDIGRGGDEPPTHFDALTAVGFVAMHERAVQAMVVEVGLGGRFDSTNVIDACVGVVTNVALDHTELLGATTNLIAAEKAGIIAPGATAVIGEGDGRVVPVFAQRCREVGARLLLASRDFEVTGVGGSAARRTMTLRTPRRVHRDVAVPFEGMHQVRNAACALVAAEEFLDQALDDNLVAEAWRAVPNPARFEVVGSAPAVVMDVAHNPHGVTALVEALDDRFPGRERVVVLGVNPHKDADAMLGLLRAGSRELVTTESAAAPAIPAAALAKAASAAGWERVHAESRPPDAIALAFELAGRDDVIVCTGSHYWLGSARQQLLERAGG
ncbi:MAG TPA: Mur ligase family protein [Acidimicrobiales bacterium]|nr:Mur ligase family protein [Acidimicrobiales bacterium]